MRLGRLQGGSVNDNVEAKRPYNCRTKKANFEYSFTLVLNFAKWLSVGFLFIF